MICPQPEKAGGLSEAARLSFRPPSAARCAVVACYLSYETLPDLHPSFRLPGEGRKAVVGCGMWNDDLPATRKAGGLSEATRLRLMLKYNQVIPVDHFHVTGIS